MQLEKNCEHVSDKLKDTYTNIKDTLTKIVEEKEQLKMKVKEDTTKTSDFIKQMEKQKT